LPTPPLSAPTTITTGAVVIDALKTGREQFKGANFAVVTWSLGVDWHLVPGERMS